MNKRRNNTYLVAVDELWVLVIEATADSRLLRPRVRRAVAEVVAVVLHCTMN
jgi:hypothetical protein